MATTKTNEGRSIPVKLFLKSICEEQGGAQRALLRCGETATTYVAVTYSGYLDDVDDGQIAEE